ncbi:diuretic hormone 44 isoform X2 [Polistes fuscatus]|nr:diuretic hormone 44 isoform X2 [Polistes fuscatus]
MPELEREMYDSSNDPGPTTILRTKRIGSLSIVNNLDVLRERILLELARRKAMQDQRQIDANRLMLDKIGKRSLPPVYEDYSSSSHPRNLERIYNWVGESGSIVGDRHSDQERRVASNELLW